MPVNSTQEQTMNIGVHEGSSPGGGNPQSRIRALNDALRRTFVGGRVVMTAGVAALPEATRVAVLAAVRAFEAFTPRNDPHGEHDFGSVEIDDVRVFWKVDCYDRALRFASPDPADTTVTARVLTIMLAEEY